MTVWLIMEERFAHSGMQVYAEELAALAAGAVRVVDDRALAAVRPAPGDWLLFNEDLAGPRRPWLSAVRGDVGDLRVGLLLHSTLAQMDLSDEIDEVLAWLDGGGARFDLIACADADFAALLAQALPRQASLWLPHAAGARLARLAAETPAAVAGRLFMPMTADDQAPFYRHKNTQAQLAAVALAQAALGEKLTLVVNYASPRLARSAQVLGVALEELGSVAAASYPAFLRTVQAGLCASFAESFCYAAFDLCALGVPALHGPAVRWAWAHAPLRRLCGVAAPGDAGALAARLVALLTDAAAHAAAAAAARQAAARAAATQAALARAALSRLLAPSANA